MHARFTTGSGWLSDVLPSFQWSGYSSLLSIPSLLPGTFAVAILGYAIFNYVPGDVALRIAN